MSRRQHSDRPSGGELGAALAASRGEDRPARAAPHPQAEAVGLGPTAGVRLERTLAHVGSPYLLRSCMPAWPPAPPVPAAPGTSRTGSVRRARPPSEAHARPGRGHGHAKTAERPAPTVREPGGPGKLAPHKGSPDRPPSGRMGQTRNHVMLPPGHRGDTPPARGIGPREPVPAGLPSCPASGGVVSVAHHGCCTHALPTGVEKRVDSRPSRWSEASTCRLTGSRRTVHNRTERGLAAG